MGTALKFLRELLEKIGLELDKRTATSLLILLVLLILLPIGLFLVRNQVSFLPRAAGELIQLGEGGCIKLDKNKKKVVDCPTVPLKLINPFFDIRNRSTRPSFSPGTSSSPVSNSPTSSSIASPSPSVAPSSVPQAIRVSGNTSTEIQAALNQLRTSGGAVYLPAGTYTINNKITVFSNVTLFGDGIDQTILNGGVSIDNDEAVVGNDTDEGNNNVSIREMTIRAHPLGSGEGIKLRNLDKGFIHNVKVEGTNTGILLGFHSGKGVNNVRVSNCQIINTKIHGIFVTLGKNNVIDNCSVNSGGSDSLGIGLEIAVDGEISGNRVISNNVSNGGHSLSFTSGNDNQSNPAWVNSANIACYNNASGNKIQPIWELRGSGNIYVGNNVAVNNVNNTSQYEEKGGTDSRCDIPAAYNIPAIPAKPIAKGYYWVDKLIGTAFAQDSDDNFTGTSGDDSDDQFTQSLSPSASNRSPAPSAGNILRYRLAESQAGLNSAQWKEFVFKRDSSSIFAWVIGTVFAQDSDDNFTGTSGDYSDDVFTAASSNPSASGPGSSGNPTFSIGKQFITTNFQLTNTQPGPKQIWVQYMHPDGSTKVDHVTFDLVDKVPQISGLACNLDITKQNLKITIDGNYFGNDIGKITTVSGSGQVEVLGWQNRQIQGSIKSSGSVAEGARYQLKVVRADGFESENVVCLVDKSLVSLGARIFCREPGKFDASDVVVTILSSAEGGKVSKVEEKVAISAAGEITNLKTQLQTGKNYAIAIKSPGSLRRTATFTASEGTTQITRPDGTPFILPVGDIAPVILPDGSINTLDRSELIRQWRVLPASGSANTKLSGDFNRDTRVNSIDWACMQYDFGSSDDPIPVEVPGAASGTITIPESASGTITIPVRSPNP